MPNRNSTACLIRNAAGIMTGLAGAAARHAGPDIRIRGSRIEAIGPLEVRPGEQVMVASSRWCHRHPLPCCYHEVRGAARACDSASAGRAVLSVILDKEE